MKLHEKIRIIRKESGLSLKELHRRIIYHYGNDALGYWTLSRIELGKHKTSHISSLEQIATGLNVTVSELYEGVDRDQPESSPFIRKTQRRGGFTFNDKAKFEIVSPSNLDFWMLEFKFLPGGKTLVKRSTAINDSLEFVYVVQGEIICHINNDDSDTFKTHTLKKGDTLTFDNRKPSYFENISNKKTTLLVYQNPKKI